MKSLKYFFGTFILENYVVVLFYGIIKPIERIKITNRFAWFLSRLSESRYDIDTIRDDTDGMELIALTFMFLYFKRFQIEFAFVYLYLVVVCMKRF